MMKSIQLFALLLLSATVLTGCSDDDTTPSAPDGGGTDFNAKTSGFLVLNQGNDASGITGSLDFFNYTDSTYKSGVFYAKNEQVLGDNPQSGVVCGSKTYVSIYKSNLIWVVDSKTFEIKGQVATTQPNTVVTDGKYVYVTNNDGFVTRIDTTNYSTRQIAVGPNPVGMAVANGYLYVANSDGYNYSNSYKDGKTVSKVRLTDFTEIRRDSVGLNPTAMAADAKGNVFVCCQGNYANIAPKVQKITADDNVTDFAAANMMAVSGTTLYLLNSVTDWTNNSTKVSVLTKNTLTGDTIASNWMLGTVPEMPTSLSVDATRSCVYITSDPSPYGYAQKGYVYQYTLGGTFMKRYNTGVHPVAVIF